MHDDVDAFTGRLVAATGKHVGRRVDPLDVEAAAAQVEHRLTVAAAEFQGGLTRFRDEPRVRLPILAAGLQRLVKVGDYACIELARIHHPDILAGAVGSSATVVIL
ncbi:MAG: hypothetical protein ACRDN9_18525 [Streptosporangiaceae bacterium]